MMSSHEREGISPQNGESTTTLNHDEDIEVPSKRVKSNNFNDDIPKLKRKNFVKACELVSQKAYFNYVERFQLIYTPVCLDRRSCMHTSTKHETIKEVPPKVTILIHFEMEANNWYGALEVCIMSITYNQYLSDVVLKNVVEIMLNAHEDLSSGYTISKLIDKCKLVLSLHFSTHCPCLHANIRDTYTRFLTSAMDTKEKTVTNRKYFGSESGIVSFCLTRLEHELEPDSMDGALLDKTKSTSEELKHNIKGLSYQKERFNIFEMLDRTERINRLMAVLHSIIELLQFDLAIWHSIGHSDLKKQLRGKKNLMDVLQSECKISRQIIKLFSYFVHLEYPEEHIQTMTLWLNAMLENYMNEQLWNKNYPSPGKLCKVIMNELYDIIEELPPKSIVNILERIKPAHVRHLISCHYLKTLLSISSDKQDSLQITIKFLKDRKWNDFPKSEKNSMMLQKLLNVKRVKPNKLLKHLSNLCNDSSINSSDNNNVIYPKLCPITDDSKIDICYVASTIYITLKSYLEAYGIQSFQDTLQKLNENLMITGKSGDTSSINNYSFHPSYVVTELFVKKYIHIFDMLKEFIQTIKQLESESNPPEILNIFKNILDSSKLNSCEHSCFS